MRFVALACPRPTNPAAGRARALSRQDRWRATMRPRGMTIAHGRCGGCEQRQPSSRGPPSNSTRAGRGEATNGKDNRSPPRLRDRSNAQMAVWLRAAEPAGGRWLANKQIRGGRPGRLFRAPAICIRPRARLAARAPNLSRLMGGRDEARPARRDRETSPSSARRLAALFALSAGRQSPVASRKPPIGSAIKQTQHNSPGARSRAAWRRLPTRA